MPTLVDEQVVSLEFQNKNFEKNVKESLDSIEKLKKSLDFTKAGEGLESIDNTANKCDFRVMQEGLVQVQAHISILDQLAMNWLNRMENKVLDVSEKLVKSMSTEQISAGWDKYAEKTSAVQTIMAATASQFEDTATQMNYVNDQLSKLNWFTDETSYNFLDMVNNIGKFTSNQISLDDSVTAMQGISTWAAISGANVNEAGRAMYNLAQAIGIGAVKLMDWKSIENANMATAEFKQTAIDTAVAMGTLVDLGDGLYETSKEHEVSVRNFNENLKDEWFTSEVLIATLNEYGGFTNALYDFIESTDLDYASEAIQYIDEFVNHTIDMEEASEATGMAAEELEQWLTQLGSAEFELGRKSFAAAQQAKTFKEAIDSVKDAASTAWMNIFETIFGDFQKAKVLWTDLANNLYDIFVGPINEKAEILTEAFTSNWEILSKQMSNAGISATQFKEALSRSYFKYYAKDLEDVIKEYGGLEEAIKAGAFSAHTLKDALLSLTGSADSLKDIRENLKMGDTGDDVREVQQALADLGYEFEQFGVDGIIGKETEGIIKMFQEANNLEVTGIIDEATLQALRDANGITSDLVESWFGLVENIDQLGGRDLFIGGLANLGNTFLEIWNAIFPAKSEEQISEAAGIVYEIVYAFNAATEALLNFVSGEGPLKTIIEGITSVFALLKEVIGGAITGIVNLGMGALSLLSFIPEVLAMLAGLVGYVATMIVQSGIISGLIGTVTGAIRGFASAIHDTVFEYIDFIKNNENLMRIGNAISGILGKLRMSFRYISVTLGGGTGIIDKIKSLGATLKDLSKIGIDNVLGKIADWFERIASKDFLQMSQDFSAKVLSMKQSVIDFFTNFKVPSAEEVVGYFTSLKTRISEFISGNLFTDENGEVQTKGILGFLNKYQQDIADFCTNFKIPTLSDLIEYLKGVKETIFNFFTGSGEKEGVLKTVDRRGSDNVIINYLLKQKRAIEDFISNFSIDYEAIYAKVNEIFTNTTTFISEKFTAIKEKIKLPSFTEIVEKVKGWFDSIAQKLQSIDAEVIRATVIQKFNEWKQPVLDLLASIGGVFLLAFDKLKVLFAGAFEKVSGWIKEGIEKAFAKFDSLKGYFKGLWEKLLANITGDNTDDGVLKTVKRRGGFVDKIKNWFETTFVSVGTWIVGAIDKIKEIFGTVKGFLGDAWTKGVDAVFGFIGKIIDAIAKIPAKQIISFASSLLLLNTLGNISLAIFTFSGLMKSIGRFFDSARKAFSHEDNLGDTVQKIANAIVRVLAAIFIMATFGDETKMTTATNNLLKIVGLIGGLIIVIELINAFASFKGWKTGTGNIGLAFAGIAFAIGLLGTVLRKLQDIEVGVGTILKLSLIGLVLGGMYAGLAVLKKMKFFIDWKDALPLVIIAGVFEILADVMKQINRIEISKNFGEKLALFAALVAGLFFFVKEMGAAGSWKDMVGILAVAIAMEVLVDVLKKIQKWNLEVGGENDELLPLIGKMSLVFGAMFAFLKMVQLAVGKDGIGKVGFGILAIAGAMEILVLVMKQVSSMTVDELQKGLTVVIILGAVLSAMIAITKFGSGSIDSVGKVMLSMAGAIGIIAAIIFGLSKMSKDDLVKGTLAVAGIATILGILVKVTEKSNAKWGVFIAMAAAIAAIAASISYLAIIPSDDLLHATEAIGAIMGILALDLLFSSFGSIGSKIASIIEIFVTLGMVVYAIKEVADLGSEEAFAAGEAILKSCEGLAAVLVATTIVGTIGNLKSIATGIVGLDLLVGDILVIMWRVGKVINEHMPEGSKKEIMEALRTGADVISELGTLIGEFTGKLVGGFKKGRDEVLLEDYKDFMADIQDLMDQIDPFVDSMSDSKLAIMSRTLKNFGEFTKALSEAELNSFLTKPLEASEAQKYTWGDRLALLAQDIIDFSNTIGDNDISNVEPAARAIKKIAVACKDIPLSGGIIDDAGGVDIEKFGTGLGTLAGGLKTFTDAFNNVEVNVEGATGAISLLGAMAKEDIPSDQNNLISWITGVPDYAGFSAGLESISAALATYITNVGDITKGDVDDSVEALQIITKFAKEDIPTEGGWLSWLLGDHTIGTFATNLESLGGALNKYNDLTSGISIGRVDLLTASITKLTTAFTDEFMMNFEGNVSGFGVGIENLSRATITDFLSTWSEITDENDPRFGEIGSSIAFGIANGISESAVDELNTDPFADAIIAKVLTSIDSKFKSDDLIDVFKGGLTLSDFGTETGSDFSSIGQSIAEMITKGITESTAEESDVEPFVSLLMEKVLASFDSKVKEASAKGVELVRKFRNGINSMSAYAAVAARLVAIGAVNALGGVSAYTEGAALARTFRDGIESEYSIIVKAGEYLGDGVIKGIQNKTEESVKAAETYAKAVTDAMKGSNGFGEESPSKVTTIFGQYLDEGVDIGLERGTSTSIKTATAYAQNVLGAMSDVLDGSTEVVPAITPAFDLRAIQNGANSMSRFVNRNALEATVIANTMSDVNTNKMDTLISVANAIQKTVSSGKDIYLNEKLIIGRVNKKLGGYM
ncbi:MAG: peptidoglycan-binding protein [Prevotellaceae bacterium]|nr:peptidoglycan-binding protein [Candidatus Faecinaster equi]